MSQEEKAQIEAILQSRDYYEILGVSRFGLDQDTLRRNYIKVGSLPFMNARKLLGNIL